MGSCTEHKHSHGHDPVYEGHCSTEQFMPRNPLFESWSLAAVNQTSCDTLKYEYEKLNMALSEDPLNLYS